MKRFSLSVVLYLCLVFLSGVVVGAFGYGLYHQHTVQAQAGPDAGRLRYLEDIRKRLKLRNDQFAKVTVILDSTRDRFHEVREKYKPELKAIQEQQNAAIRAILDDSQKAEYEKMRAERDHPQPNKSQPGH